MRLFEWILGKGTKSECDRLKVENEQLEQQIASLLGELQEANTKYDYKVSELEKKIVELTTAKNNLVDTMKAANEHLMETQWQIDAIRNEKNAIEIDLTNAKEEIKSIKKLAKAEKQQLEKEISQLEVGGILEVPMSDEEFYKQLKSMSGVNKELLTKKRGRPRKVRD
jgi:chromosome segregation ATPase